MSNVDIFIKTYWKDFQWLKFCLASIQKFASGFRAVVIVSDLGELVPSQWLFDTCRVYYVAHPKKWPTKDAICPGYFWQQAIKLNWHRYTDADAVFIMDSDWMFTKPTTPQDFQIKGKYYWFYRDWNQAGKAIQWKPAVEKILQEPAPYEAMVIAGFMLTRPVSLAFKKHICLKHGKKEIWDVIVHANAGKISEFNIFGNFIFFHANTEYECLLHVSPAAYHNQSIHSSWSWRGAIDENDRIYRQRVLAS